MYCEVMTVELYKEILSNILQKQSLQVTFPNLNINAVEIVALESYAALQKIKAILEEDSLEDRECFMRIEEIICLFEELGSNCGQRHDF